VAIKRLPILADAGKHGASGRVDDEGPDGHSVSGLATAGGANVEAVGAATSNVAFNRALVTVHDVLSVVRDALLA
jgi:hypothetical protein